MDAGRSPPSHGHQISRRPPVSYPTTHREPGQHEGPLDLGVRRRRGPHQVPSQDSAGSDDRPGHCPRNSRRSPRVGILPGRHPISQRRSRRPNHHGHRHGVDEINQPGNPQGRRNPPLRVLHPLPRRLLAVRATTSPRSTPSARRLRPRRPAALLGRSQRRHKDPGLGSANRPRHRRPPSGQIRQQRPQGRRTARILPTQGHHPAAAGVP
uniref:(northern house mosquito) hypothetical protein n=1 Tax=Culex pipiens TaxID=7175 RepID=A0A8D8FK84_CULPI